MDYCPKREVGEFIGWSMGVSLDGLLALESGGCFHRWVGGWVRLKGYRPYREVDEFIGGSMGA